MLQTKYKTAMTMNTTFATKEVFLSLKNWVSKCMVVNIKAKNYESLRIVMI